MALGRTSGAYSPGSVAIGTANRAWLCGQTVVGRFNAVPSSALGGDGKPVPDLTADPQDEVFVVGGGHLGAPKTALTVTAQGNVQAAGSVSAAGATISGSSTFSGNAVFQNGVTIQGTVDIKAVPPKGGISMEGFGTP